MSDTDQTFILAIDIGTSSVKAGLYDGAARSLAEHDDAQVSIEHEQVVASDGTAEEPVERIGTAVETAVDRVLAVADSLNIVIAGVGMDSMASTVLAVDESGAPLTPVYTYADTRSAEDVEQLRTELDVSAVHDRTGAMQHTSYVPGRVRWLQRTEPEIAARVARWLDVSTYLFTRWFGAQDVAASYSIAAWSGMLNRRELQWDRQLLSHLGLQLHNLPRLGPYSERQAGLSAEFAKRWPKLAHTPFFPAVGDGAAVNVGTGCATPDRVALSVGTTSAMRVLIEGDSPPVPGGLWAYRLGDNATLVGGAFSEGGLLVEWAQNVLRLPPLDQLDAALTNQTADGHGLTVLPFLAGERATGWSTRATGVFEGLRTSTTALDMVQAMMESVSLRFALVADLLLPQRPPELKFIASGGAVRSSAWWLQTMANALDAPVVVNVEEQGTSRGAAILALHALGKIDSLHSLPPASTATYTPQPGVTAVLRAAAGRQQALYSRVID
jgi:gluconokinase